MAQSTVIKELSAEDIRMIFTDPFASAVLSYINLISSKWNSTYAGKIPDRFCAVAGGRKYLKIVNMTAGWVHSFVEITTGDILKAASWDAVTKGARGNIYKNFGADALTECGQVRYLTPAYLG